MQIDAITAIIWAAGVTGFFTAATAIAVTWITKRSDERRHVRELCMHTAVENWKVVAQIAREAGHGELMPLDVFVVHMLKFSELLTAKNLTAAQVEEKMREVGTVVRQAVRSAEAFTAETKPDADPNKP